MTRPFLLVILVALLVPAAARADVTLTTGKAQVGRIHLVATTTNGQELRIVEEVDGGDAYLGVADASVPYTCKESRSFAAIAGEERTAPFVVTTPSCAKRLKISTLRTLDLGDDLRVTLVDRWHQGALSGRVCATPPNRPSQCRPLNMPAPSYATHRLFRATTAGVWRIDATTQYGSVSRFLRVVHHRRGRSGTQVLFTGDSMMLTPRHVLINRLPKRVRTIDDIFVGSGVTRPFVVNWGKLPARQVRTYRPDATIISLGMGDSRAIGKAPCCGEKWIAAYAQRDRQIMKTYVQGGSASVVWLSLPFGRDPKFWPAEAAVNVAIARAALGMVHVEVVDLYSMFTPDGAFHAHVVRDGRRLRVRTTDGIHLTRAGARIASTEVMARLRGLGVIG